MCPVVFSSGFAILFLTLFDGLLQHQILYLHQAGLVASFVFIQLHGDITNRPEYKAHMMRLQATESYTVNSKGESVPIHEVAWGDENDVPTHMYIQFTSSHGGAYIGSPGNTLWVDNVKLVY